MAPFKTISLNVSADAIIGTTLSAGSIIYAQSGNSTIWNQATTVVQNNSAIWVPEDLAIAYAIAL